MSGRRCKLHLRDFSERSKYRFFHKRRRLCVNPNEEAHLSALGTDDCDNGSRSSRHSKSSDSDSSSNADTSDHEFDGENVDRDDSGRGFRNSVHDDRRGSNDDERNIGDIDREGNGDDIEIDHYNINEDDADDDTESNNYEENDNDESNNDEENDGEVEGSSGGNDSESESGSDQEDNLEGGLPLFEGAPITVGESLSSILTFALRFAITGVALEAVLKLISMHCPTPNLCKKSLYLFRKYFAPITVPLRRQYYCVVCYNRLTTSASICENCTERDPSEETKVAYFIEIPLQDQLRTLYRRQGFSTLLQWRFRRNKKNMNNYEDIYDGEIYKSLSEPPNLLSNRNNISFTWNTDGVSIFKSSKYQIWPFYLSINELPYTHRTRKENLLLAGLWFGRENGKPFPSLFLNNICSDLEELKNGIDIETPDQNHPVRLHAEVLCGTCDLPAKALFMNMKQYNGEYGCQKCKIRSKPRDKSGTSRVYPFSENLPLRTQEETENFAREATLSRDDVCGVKGPSIISRFSPNYIRTTAVDSMHCVFLGVVRALLLLWFQPGNGLLSEFSAVVDEKICSITPPSFVPRLPRAIMNHIMYLKAHELKAWFLYYSLPILHTIMSPLYFEHYALFVYGIYILNRASISEQDISLAEELLTEFVSQYSDLYGKENMTANLHQILHLAECSRDFGPLWTTSCFPYENANGVLKTLVTGTKYADLQISSGVSLFINLPEITKKLVPNSPPFNFCKMLTDKKKKFKTHHIIDNIAVIGILGKINDVPENIHQALRSSDINGTSMRVFYRISISGMIFTSELYQRSKRTNSMVAKYKTNGSSKFGMIQCFIKVSNCDCRDICREICDTRYFAVVKTCQTMTPFSVQGNILLPFIHRCMAITDTADVIDVHDLECVCFFVKMIPENISYIAEPVNTLEME